MKIKPEYVEKWPSGPPRGELRSWGWLSSLSLITYNKTRKGKIFKISFPYCWFLPSYLAMSTSTDLSLTTHERHKSQKKPPHQCEEGLFRFHPRRLCRHALYMLIQAGCTEWQNPFKRQGSEYTHTWIWIALHRETPIMSGQQATEKGWVRGK